MTLSQRHLLLASSGLACVLAAQTDVIEPRFVVPSPDWSPSGQHVAFIGDSDGDGCDDFVVGDQFESNGTSGFWEGSIRCYSGRTGGLRYTLFGNYGWSLGHAVAGIGDIDGDGAGDFVAGAPRAEQSGQSWRGLVQVFSGRTGGLVRTLTGASAATYATQFGSSVASAGDTDRDGTPDLLVGVPQIGNGSTTGPGDGMVVVFSGANGRILRRLTGQPLGDGFDGFGRSVGNAGDVDGDGYDDWVVGAPGDGVEASGGRPGAVYVFSGRTGALLQDFRGVTIPNYSQFGKIVSGVGDVNGDGLDDVAASASGTVWEIRSVLDRRVLLSSIYGDFISAAGDVDGDGGDDLIVGNPPWGGGGAVNGWVRVYGGGGPTLTRLHNFQEQYTLVGYAVAGGGDLNGDGFSDFLFDTSGGVRAYLGRPRAAFQRLHLQGDAANDRLGWGLAGVGDVDGDGRDDIAIGAYSDDHTAGVDQGSVRVVAGDGLELYRWYGDAAGDYFGVAVDGAGDVDGDGTPDVVVGASGADRGALVDAGMARIHSGADGRVLHTFYGVAASDYFGGAVAAAGDIDGDGHDDVIVGASYADSPTIADTGSARVLSGADGRVLWTFYGNAVGDRFGYRVDGVGDVTGDGVPDLLVSAYLEDGPNGVDSGCVYLFSGADGARVLRLCGDQANVLFGISARGAGDVDGDGRPDVIAGANSATGRDGYARVYRGDGTRIHDLKSDGSWTKVGYAVDGAGDVNGDGHADLIVGGRNYVRVYSGRDGGVLMYHFTEPNSVGYGLSVAGAGDTDGDGFAEVLIGDYVRTSTTSLYQAGAAWLWGFGYGASPVLRPGTLRSYGAGCPGANGRQPRIGAASPAALGDTLSLTLRGGPLDSPSIAVLLLGARQSVSLDPIGLFGCTLLVASFDQPQVTTDAAGRARLDLAVPVDGTLVGALLHGQWLVADSGAPRWLPIALSDALAIAIGR